MTDRELIEAMARELTDLHRVREVTGIDELWAVTVEYHSREEKRYVFTKNVVAEDIISAINIVGDLMGKFMEKLDLSDYHIMSAVIVPELH